jgi:hypothetical protein
MTGQISRKMSRRAVLGGGVALGPAAASQASGNEIAGTDPCSLAATDILEYQILRDGVNGASPY